MSNQTKSNPAQASKVADWLDTTSLSGARDRRNFVGLVENRKYQTTIVQLDIYSRVRVSVTSLVPTTIRNDHHDPYPWVRFLSLFGI